jgi:hypothetical protein
LKLSKPTKKDKETPKNSAAGRGKKNTAPPASLLNVTSCSSLPLEGDDLLSPLTGTGHIMNDSFEESTRLSIMWDGMAITFAKMGLRDFFLDAKRSVYVFLVQS